MSPAPVRTLVIHTGGIGDFLLTCPALRILAHDGPLELLGYPERLALAVAGGLAQAAHSIDSVGFESVFSEPGTRLREFLAPFDRAVVWMRDDGQIEKALRCCGLEEILVRPGLPPEDWARHASAYYLGCLGVQEEPPPFRLGLTPAEPGLDVVIHPGSGGTKKNWPLANFEAVAKAFCAAGRQVAWSLGPAEEEFALGGQGQSLRAASLVDLAHRLTSAKLYIGNDSGITHLAAASGCRIIALFGPTNPAIWAPLGENVAVLQGTPWPSVEAVLASLRD